MSEKKDKPLVTKEFTKPCGCHVAEFSDETAEVRPCVPCALLEAARALSGAGQAIAAAAQRARQDFNNAAMLRAIGENGQAKS